MDSALEPGSAYYVAFSKWKAKGITLDVTEKEHNAILAVLKTIRHDKEAGEARDKLNFIFREGVKDPAVKLFLERVDQQRAEYFESQKDDVKVEGMPHVR